MYALIIHFEILDSKIHEFDVFSRRLREWPVYAQHHSIPSTSLKQFVLIKNWTSEQEMKSDLNSSIYDNLLGAINVLGNKLSSELLETCNQLN